MNNGKTHTIVFHTVKSAWKSFRNFEARVGEYFKYSEQFLMDFVNTTKLPLWGSKILKNGEIYNIFQFNDNNTYYRKNCNKKHYCLIFPYISFQIVPLHRITLQMVFLSLKITTL